MRADNRYRLLAVAAALFVVFSLGFFLGRNSIEYDLSADVQKKPEQALEPLEELPEAEEEPQEEAPQTEEAEALPVQQSSGEVQLININTATKDELMTLPGVGEVLAERIIAYRQEYGRFVTTQQLTDISGIGEQRYAQLEALVTVGE